MAFKQLSIRVLAATLLFIGLQSFNSMPGGNDLNYQLSVTTHGTDFELIAEQLYGQLDLCEDEISQVTFEKALRGYVFLRYTNQLENTRFLTVLDFSRSSKDRRLWVIDLEGKKVVYNELAAHGKNSGDKFAKWFSNAANSKKSSLGFYVTGETYNGRHRYSLKLRGLEPGFNSNAFARGIVMHGAHYVSDEIAYAQDGVGRSFGCPAVSNEVNRDIVDLVEGGSCLFMYHPQAYYNGKSKILNTNQFIPIELLKALVE
ncbi:MAG: murein L,D-transpeptidase catalytic domain family protein [Bacteroidia bacterium]|nr:murein L,D-transpeptidase catalytic domain family protein [Bacteroidia bacterium]